MFRSFFYIKESKSRLLCSGLDSAARCAFGRRFHCRTLLRLNNLGTIPGFSEAGALCVEKHRQVDVPRKPMLFTTSTKFGDSNKYCITTYSSLIDLKMLLNTYKCQSRFENIVSTMFNTLVWVALARLILRRITFEKIKLIIYYP